MEISEKMSIMKSKLAMNLSLRSTERMHSCESILRILGGEYWVSDAAWVTLVPHCKPWVKVCLLYLYPQHPKLQLWYLLWLIQAAFLKPSHLDLTSGFRAHLLALPPLPSCCIVHSLIRQTGLIHLQLHGYCVTVSSLWSRTVSYPQGCRGLSMQADQGSPQAHTLYCHTPAGHGWISHTLLGSVLPGASVLLPAQQLLIKS